MADARRALLKDQTDISGARALIVEARFYDDIQDAMLEGAIAEYRRRERRFGGFAGTFSPSRRHSRSTRLWFTANPSARKSAVTRR